jgi:sugar/nucleoside kinase (ribokinase family)
MTRPPPSIDCLCAGIVVADFICAPVSHVPEAGGLVMTDAISLAVGGCASNVAVDLARLGRKVVVAGRIGSDMPGRFVRDELSASGVDTRYLVDAREQTSSTLVVNVCQQDRRFIHAFGASAFFDASEITPALVQQARVLYLGGFGLMPRLTGDRVAELFQTARAAGVPTVLDVVVPDPESCRKQLDKVLPWTDVFLPNTDEGRLLTGIADPFEQARHFQVAGAETVVITCGNKGAVLTSRKETLRAGAFSVEFIDGTGSGDAFAAGYISGLIDGCAAERCLEIGSALGASCVRRSGATTGVLTQGELADFLARHRLAVERL